MDRLRLVTFSPGGRPIVVRDLENGATYEKYRDSFAITAPPSHTQMAAGTGRYAGQRAVGELHDNATISWTARVAGVTPDAALANVEGLIADWEVALGGRFIEWRPDGASGSIFFEIRAPAEWTWKYAWAQFTATASSIVECKVQVAPRARLAQMDVADDFSTDTTSDYTFDSGAANQVSIAGGQLTAVSSLGTEKRLAHTARGYAVLDAQDTIKGVPGSTITGYKLGVLARRSAADTCIVVYVDDNGTNSRLRIDKVVAGATTNLSSTNLAARVTAGAALWVRGRVEGNVVYAEHFTTVPTPLAAPATSASYALTTAEQAALPAGTGGITWTPQHAAATVDDFEHAPFTYRGLTLPEYIALGGPIPGTADALADISVTTFQNLVTNPGFEVDTSGWSVAIVTGVINAATSITRDTGTVAAGAASGKVVTPGSAVREGTAFALSGTFYADAAYRVRVRVLSTTAGVGMRLRLGSASDKLDATFTSTTTWQTMEGTWTPAADTSTAYLAVLTGDSAAAATFYIDDILLTAPGPPWAAIGWTERPPVHNMVWNGDFEEDVNGWSGAAVTGVQAAAGTSITRDTTAARTKYGSANAVIVAPASVGAGANFPIYQRFRRGVTYTATIWASAASATTAMVLKLGVNGDVATSSAAALGTGVSQWTVTWTPTADREVAYLSFQTNAATATTYNIDAVAVYEGTAAPMVGRHAEGAGAAAPIGIVEAESADTGDLTGWAIASDASSRVGYRLIDTSVVGAETYTAGWWIDPSLLVADDFTQSEIDIEVCGLFTMASTVTSPRAILSARPEWGSAFGAERFTNEHAATGKLLTRPSSGTARRLVRLGTLTLPVDPARPARWKLWLTASTATGSTGTFGLDYLKLMPSRRRIAGATAKANDASYPGFVASTAETTRTILSDLRGLVAKPPFAGQPVGGGFAGPAIELPPGATDLYVKLSSLVPDDPTSDATTEQLAHTGTVHVAVTPQVHVAKAA